MIDILITEEEGAAIIAGVLRDPGPVGKKARELVRWAEAAGWAIPWPHPDERERLVQSAQLKVAGGGGWPLCDAVSRASGRRTEQDLGS